MLVAVPTMLHRMVELAPDVIANYDTSSLKAIVIAGSALSPRAVQPRARTPSAMCSTTSTAPPSAGSPPSPPLTSCEALPERRAARRSTCEVVLFDEHDQRVDGANKRGRIFVRSGARFEGYTDGRTQADHRRLYVQRRHGPLRRERAAVRRRA